MNSHKHEHSNCTERLLKIPADTDVGGIKAAEFCLISGQELDTILGAIRTEPLLAAWLHEMKELVLFSAGFKQNKPKGFKPNGLKSQ